MMLRVMHKSWDDLKQKESLCLRREQGRTFAFHPLVECRSSYMYDEILARLQGHRVPQQWNPNHDEHSYRFPQDYNMLCLYMISRDQMHLIPHAVRPSEEKRKMAMASCEYAECVFGHDAVDHDDTKRTKVDTPVKHKMSWMMCKADDKVDRLIDHHKRKETESRGGTSAHALRNNNKEKINAKGKDEGVAVIHITHGIITAFRYGHLHVAKRLIARWNSQDKDKARLCHGWCVHAAACRGDIAMAEYMETVMEDRSDYLTEMVRSLTCAAEHGHAKFFHYALSKVERHIAREDSACAAQLKNLLDTVITMQPKLWMDIGARFPSHHQCQTTVSSNQRGGKDEEQNTEVSIDQLIQKYGSKLSDECYESMLRGFPFTSRHELYQRYCNKHEMTNDALQLQLRAAVHGGNVETCKFIIARHPNVTCVIYSGPMKNRHAFYQYLTGSEDGKLLRPFLHLHMMIAYELKESTERHYHAEEDDGATLKLLLSLASKEGTLGYICNQCAPLALLLENRVFLSHVDNNNVTLNFNTTLLCACAYKNDYTMFQKMSGAADKITKLQRAIKDIQLEDGAITYTGQDIARTELWDYVMFRGASTQIARMERSKMHFARM